MYTYIVFRYSLNLKTLKFTVPPHNTIRLIKYGDLYRKEKGVKRLDDKCTWLLQFF